MSDRGGGKRILLADIGGTNARFALLEGAELGPVAHIPAAGHAQFADALRAYLETAGGSIDAAVLAVAGVVAGGRCALTNNPWVVDAASRLTGVRAHAHHLRTDTHCHRLSFVRGHQPGVG